MPEEQPITPPKKNVATKKGRSWRKRLGCGCLTFLFALALGAVVLEWYLLNNGTHFLGSPVEAMDMYEMDGNRSYRLKPGWQGSQTIEDRTTQIIINSRGNRGSETGPKAAGELRILMFGDSYVFGHGVAEVETIPARLEARLRAESSPTIRVVNCGISGQGLRDLTRNLERHRDLDPDLIIACTYIGNDFTDDCRVYTAITEGFLLMGPMARMAHTSTRFQLTLRYRTLALLDKVCLQYTPTLAFDRSRLQPNAEEIESEALFPPESQRLGCLYFDRRADDALVEKILGRCRTHYSAMATIAGDTPILHVLIPGKWHVHEPLWRKQLKDWKLDPDNYDLGTAQRRLLKLAEELGMKMRDLTGPLTAEVNRDRLWFKVDRHFSPAGCDYIAAWLVPEVKRMLGK